jgi:simple sugar transport system permease protein
VQGAAVLAAVLFAMAVGAAIIAAIGQDPWQLYAHVARFNLRPASLASILFRATPLIFAGLAVALSFRVLLFNIGAEGQYYVGGFCGALSAFAFRGLPAAVHLPVVALTAVGGAAAWGLVPILLKLRRGAHEVITTIMMNYIAGAVILWLLGDYFVDPGQGGTPRLRTPLFADSARVPTLHAPLAWLGFEIPSYSRLNWLLPAAVLLCAAVSFYLSRSRFGYEARAVAGNPAAAEAAGIRIERVQLAMFLGSAGVAGLVGLNDLLGFFGYFDIDFPRGLGFSGISVALLARNNPLAIVPAALLFGYLERGAEGIQIASTVPKEVVAILQATIILSIVVAYELAARATRAMRKREAA